MRLDKKRRNRKRKRDRVFGIMGMFIAIATAFVTIHAPPLHVPRNCAIFVVITSIVLRNTLRKVATTPVPPRHMEEEQKS